MNTIMQLKGIDILFSILRICITYYLATKIINEPKYSKSRKITLYIFLCIISFIYVFIRNTNGFLNSMIALIILLSFVFTINTKNKIGYSLCIVAIALSINYILYFITLCITYIPIFMLRANGINDYINFIIVMLINIIVVYLFLKIKRFKKGFSFLQKKLNNDYFDVMILNVGIIIVFLITLIVTLDYEARIINDIGVLIVLYTIIMFITIQKSLKLYYKQKMLVKELNETKEELENKKKEVEELEEENLNFSKISHSIAHKQKSLEYKLNKLIMKSEMASELDLKNEIFDITKELKNETAIELSKTDITEIDDMLSYMQSECIKNKIDFQLQLNGNIHHMINNYIDKEKLEILLADLIKNAIIAINYSENTNISILVRLGIIEGIYSLYVYDSGIEFELDTLANLGIKPSTTHADNGGTGMGMMNTFDTLKKYNASIHIQEYGKPSKDNFTKVIEIIFDKKNEFKIISYRQNEVEKKKEENNKA